MTEETEARVVGRPLMAAAVTREESFEFVDDTKRGLEFDVQVFERK